MKTFFACLVLVFVAFHDASAVNYTDCPANWSGGTEGKGKVTSVQINNCPEDDDRCKIIFWRMMNISIAFDNFNDFTNAKVQALVLYGPKYFQTSEVYNSKNNPCEDGGLSCPLKKGESYTYKQSIYTPQTYPSGNHTVRWTIRNDKFKYIICVDVPVVFSSYDDDNNHVFPTRVP